MVLKNIERTSDVVYRLWVLYRMIFGKFPLKGLCGCFSIVCACACMFSVAALFPTIIEVEHGLFED